MTSLIKTARFLALAATGAAFLVLPGAAPAQTSITVTHKPQGAKMTEAGVRRFMDDVKALTSALGAQKSPQELSAFFERHLADHGRFSSQVTYHLPGFPPRTADMAFSKSDYIQSILSGHELMQEYHSTLTIKSLKIARDGKSATLETSSQEKGRLPWPDGEDQKILPIEGTSDCVQRLIISAQNYIQMESADCVTAIAFSVFEGPLKED